MPFTGSKFAQVMPASAHQRLLDMAVKLLDDDEGISGEAFDAMVRAFSVLGVDASGVFSRVKRNDGRFYLPEDFAIPF